LFGDPDQQADDDGHQGGQGHALEFHGAQGDLGAADPHHEGDGGEDHVAGLGVVHLLLQDHADAGGGDDAEQQQEDPAHDRHRDAADQGADLADEGDGDGDDRGPADDPDAEHPGDGHDPDVLAVGGVGGGPD